MRTDIKRVISHFQNIDPNLAEIISEINYEEWFEDHETETNTIFKSLCRTIIGQQLAGSAVKAIFSRFEKLLNYEITPDKVLSISPEKVREVGLSWAKVRSITDLSTKVKDGSLALDGLMSLENDKLIQELDLVRGIGKWTAEMFLMFNLGREDIFSWGDLGLNKGLTKFAGQNKSPEERFEIVQSWSPYKTYGAIAMWHLLDNR